MRENLKNIFLFCVFGLLLGSCQKKTTWDIQEFGAVANDSTVNTKAIQKAIDACSKAGGGTVLIKDGTYTSGTILLKSNINLHIAENATLLSSINPNDFVPIDPFIDATGQYRGQCLIGAMDVENVSITGKGTIDGRGEKFYPKEVKKTLQRLGIKEKKHDYSNLISKNNRYAVKKIRYGNRPFLIRFVRVKNSIFKDIKLRQPAAWTLHFFQCDQFLVDGIDIHSKANRNNDGIDIDSSTNGKIINSHINSDDDAICFKGTSAAAVNNIYVENCKMSSGWGGVKFGTESMGDFKNITIKNCSIYDNRGGGIKILSVDGANIENIIIDHIDMKNVDMPIFIRLGERGLSYRGEEQRPVGSINNVKISNINAVTRSIEDSRIKPPAGIFITGTPNHKIKNVSIENVNIKLPGGGTKELKERKVPENEFMYPEYTKFDGALPAYGLFARHISGLKTTNVVFELSEKEERAETLFVDVNE